MSSPRQSAVRVLQLMMVASLVLPAVLFAWASWLNYRHEYAIADERIERSLDILHEHTLKVFQTIERTIAEVEELVEVGELDPDTVHTPSVFVKRIFQGENYERRIEKRTVRKA